jgi:hypothetical protein
MIMNYDWGMGGEEASVSYLKIMFQHSLVWLNKSAKDLAM